MPPTRFRQVLLLHLHPEAVDHGNDTRNALRHDCGAIAGRLVRHATGELDDARPERGHVDGAASGDGIGAERVHGARLQTLQLGIRSFERQVPILLNPHAAILEHEPMSWQQLVDAFEQRFRAGRISCRQNL